MSAKKQKSKKSQKNSQKTPVIAIPLAIVLVAIVVFGGLTIVKEATKSEEDNIVSSDTNTATLYDGDSEKTDNGNTGHDQKDAYEAERKDQEAERDETSGKKVAKPIIAVNSNEQMIIINAKITEFVELGGGCTYTISNGATSKTYTKEVVPDAKTTTCDAVALQKSELSSGEWQVKVEYKSDGAEGVSDIVKFTN